MLPRATRFKRPLLRCKACDPKAEVSGHAPQAAIAAPSGFQPAAARSSALTSKKVAAPDGFAPSTSRVRAGRSRCLSYRAIRSANRSCTGLSPIPAACVATNALAEFEMVGHLGAAPSVSPIRTARSAVFLVPGHIVSFEKWSQGESHPDLRNAIASSCFWTMAPKWTRAPDSHRVIRFCRPMVRRLCLARVFVMG